jgi:hypothetical protein
LEKLTFLKGAKMQNEGESSCGQTEKDQEPLRRVFIKASITGLHSDEILEMNLPVRKMPLGMQGPEGANLFVKYGSVYYPAKENRYGEISIVSDEVWSVDGQTWSTPERRKEIIERMNKNTA